MTVQLTSNRDEVMKAWNDRLKRSMNRFLYGLGSFFVLIWVGLPLASMVPKESIFLLPTLITAVLIVVVNIIWCIHHWVDYSVGKDFPPR